MPLYSQIRSRIIGQIASCNNIYNNVESIHLWNSLNGNISATYDVTLGANASINSWDNYEYIRQEFAKNKFDRYNVSFDQSVQYCSSYTTAPSTTNTFDNFDELDSYTAYTSINEYVRGYSCKELVKLDKTQLFDVLKHRLQKDETQWQKLFVCAYNSCKQCVND